MTVTESRVNISCGGTSNVIVRRSTVSMVSVQGRTQKRPFKGFILEFSFTFKDLRLISYRVLLLLNAIENVRVHESWQ